MGHCSRSTALLYFFYNECLINLIFRNYCAIQMSFSKFSWYRGSVLWFYSIVRWTKCKLTPDLYRWKRNIERFQYLCSEIQLLRPKLSYTPYLANLLCTVLFIMNELWLFCYLVCGLKFSYCYMHIFIVGDAGNYRNSTKCIHSRCGMYAHFSVLNMP